ncbi:FkbM family methyltransferase [Niveibacterium sp. SC-1]|uniref:FkbM family methyltransferase n=1 Tax=Niveibacterium sp. SC-1 TaxID=3135646 RepID=UPI00311D4648
MLKALFKQAVGEQRWLFMSWYRQHFGLAAALSAYLRLLRDQGMGSAPNTLTGGRVYLRPGTTDQDVYAEIFLSREYELELGSPGFVIDAGAHIGLAAVYFASRYPQAVVVAIEPEPSNFELLLRNVRAHDNIRPLRAGLWSRKTHLRIENPGVETWSFRVVEDASGQGIPAVGIADLMSEFALPRIDVLKMDIEGSEVEVLRDAPAWLDAVGALVIELHDRFRPGCTEALEAALQGRDCRRSHSGESIVLAGLARPALAH